MKFSIPWICLVLGYCTSTWQAAMQHRDLMVVYQWSQLEFDYPSEAARREALRTGEFKPLHSVPIDVDVLYTVQNVNKIFVTVPRFQDGVPATLGTITDKKFLGNPIIAPYPNWRWHQNLERCTPDRLVSVFRVKVDECGRLWVLDTGRLVDTQICPPQILAFDAASNEVLYRYELSDSLLESTSLLVTLTVDVRDRQCRDTFVYVADCQVPALIVIDIKRMKSWKIIDKTMYPYPNFGTFTIAGESFDLMDGILGMDLSPYTVGEDRTLFFHALTSGTENWVFTSDIRNQSLFAHDVSAPHIFHTYPGKRHSQAAAIAIDRNGIAFFGQVTDTSISCWNTHTLYKEENIDELSRNPETMQFPSGVKVISNARGTQELWIMTMRIQKVYTGTLNTREINFRIHAARTDDLLRNSKCRNSQNGQGNLNGYLPSLGGGYGLVRNSTKRSDTIHFPDV